MTTASEGRMGSPSSRRLALRYVLRHPVAFREFYVPKVSKRPFWHRYTFTPVLMALDRDDTMLAAGRGSGKCLAGDAIVVNPQDGSLAKIRDVAVGEQKEILTLGAGGEVSAHTITAKMSSGQQACVRVTLISGRSIVLTPSHPLMTAEGWVPAGRLRVGETIAVPQRIPTPASLVRMPDADVDLLGVLLAEGGITSSTVIYTTTDPEIVRIASEAADELGAESRMLPSGREMTHLIGRVTRNGPNPVRLMLNSYGLAHEKSIEKTIPAALFSAPDDQVVRFLSIFWMCDGYVTANEAGVALGSRELVYQIQHLLLRLGVQSKIAFKLVTNGGDKRYPSWRLTVYAACIEQFARNMSLWGGKAERLRAMVARRRNPNVGLFPTVSEEFIASYKARGDGGGKAVKCRRNLSLPLFRAWACRHGFQADYPILMNEDLWWDAVVSIEPAGIHDTYDLEVFPTACFVADDILVHNSFAVLEPEQVRHAIAHPGEETLITSLRKIHIVDRLERVIDYFEMIPFLRLYLKRVLRSPAYQLELHNDHNIYGIPVGDDPEAKMAQGKHASRITVEESQQYPERAWMKLQGAKDPRGCTTLMVGVPDGRLDTPFRKADSKYDSFKDRRFHISRVHDPFFDQKTKKGFINQYGGEDHDDYLHEVRAEWGNPVWSAWDLDALYRCVVDERELPRVYREISGKLYRQQGISPRTVLADLPRPSILGSVGAHLPTMLAADIGYTQPSDVGVFREWHDRWRLEARIRLVNRMEHDDQAALIDEIGQIYGAEQIGLDTTEGQGRAIAAELEKLDRWAPRTGGGALVTPVIRVGFNETHVSGWTPEGEELKETSKEIGTFTIRKMFAATGFALPRDEDIPAEFNKERETKTQDGKVRVVTPSDVHVTDMFRVFGMMRFLNSPPVQPGQGATEFCEPEWGESTRWASPARYL